jgi:hypothetical protein
MGYAGLGSKNDKKLLFKAAPHRPQQGVIPFSNSFARFSNRA